MVTCNTDALRLKGKFGILHLKPCLQIVSDEIEQLRLKFGHILSALFHQKRSENRALSVKYRTCPLSQMHLHCYCASDVINSVSVKV